MKKTPMIGDRARDTVTGYTGIVIGTSRWLHGCTRLTLQAPVKKDGTIPESQTFDAPQLELVKSFVVRASASDEGGPCINPVPQPSSALSMRTPQRQPQPKR